MRYLKQFIAKTVHYLCWTIFLFLLLIVILFTWLAYGIPGEWLQRYIDTYVPASMGKVSVGSVSFRLGKGLIVEDFKWMNPQTGDKLLSFSTLTTKVSLFNFEPLSQRIKHVTIDNLYVAQIVYTNSFVDPRDRYQPRSESFDFSEIDFTLAPFTIEVRYPDVLDITAERLTATCEVKNQCVYVTDIYVAVEKNSTVKGEVIVDFKGGYIDLELAGTANHTKLNGIYRALDFELLETYSDYFHIHAPSYGDAKIRIGLDKYENIFELDLDATVLVPGDFCGVHFDEGVGHIAVQGIWDTRTEITDVTVRREGEVVAKGEIFFNCISDRFSFDAEATGLQPQECYKIINLPFIEVLPPITCEQNPTIKIKGELPLLTPQRPDNVVLREGYFKSNGPCSIYGDYRVESAEMTFGMLRGAFVIPELYVTVGENQEEHLEGILEVHVPNHGEYVDIYTEFATDGLSLKKISSTFSEMLGDDAACVGVGELYCRTDETFLSTLWANFDMKINGKKLTRFNVFSIITDFMANNIPGISSITDANEFYAQGIIRNGVVDIDRARLEGSLFSIEGPVRYNFLNEEIKASLIVGIFNEDSLIGKTTRMFFLPLARTMWQVHISGTISDPKWNLQTIVGSMKNFVTGDKGKLKELKNDASKVHDDRSKNEDENTDGAFTDIFFGE